jgi:hypothetical protein
MHWRQSPQGVAIWLAFFRTKQPPHHRPHKFDEKMS